MNKYISKYKKIQNEWLKFKSKPENEKIRIRDAAKKLCLSEAELLSTQIQHNAKFLCIDNFKNFFNDLFDVDKVMFLIRTEFVVHEKNIKTKNLSYNANGFINIKEKNDILLMIDYKSIVFSFYEYKIHNKRPLNSFQFFDKYGDSVFKIYLKSKDLDKFDSISEKYSINYNYEVQHQIVLKKRFVNEFSNTLNTNLIFHNNKKIKNNCIKYSIDKSLLRLALDEASKNRVPLQIHAILNNSVQYHRDKVKNILDFGPWLNVIDKDFNIHVMEKQITKNYLIHHFINEKIFYSIEFFDSCNNHVLGISGVENHIKNFNKMLNKIGALNE